MVTKTKRKFHTYHTNVAMAARDDGHVTPINNLLDGCQFEISDRTRIFNNILSAITNYDLNFNGNPDRKIASELRSDWVELIECIKEVESRLFYWNIPRPLWEAVRTTYQPETGIGRPPSEEYLDLLRRGADQKTMEPIINRDTELNTLRGKENLIEETRDLLLRLKRLRRLFEAVPVPVPLSRTKPKMTERARLIDDLTKIFVEFDPEARVPYDADSADLQREVDRRKKDFVESVLRVFYIDVPRL
jgi:hypothetical protein